MDRGYMRITKAGETEAEQREKLVAAGVEPDHLYIDDNRKPVKGGAHDLKDRDTIIRDIRPGSRVIVTNLDRLGVSSKDIMAALGAIMAKGAAVYDLSSSKTYEGVAAGEAVADAAAAEARQKRVRVEKAREVLKTRKVKRGPKPKLDGAAKERARDLYNDLGKPIRQVSEEVGVSPTQLRRLFGERGTPPGRRKREQL
jgi:DNA invertase Pin-like site-specific DNA recombinase